MSEEKGDEISNIEMLIETEIDPRTEGDWAKWEQSRTRSFLKAEAIPIDDRKLLGQVRNQQMLLTKQRSGDTFTARLTYSLEENVGPYRIVGRPPPFRVLDSSGKTLAQTSAANLARQCGGWRKVEWALDLAPDLFGKVMSISILGEVELKKC